MYVSSISPLPKTKPKFPFRYIVYPIPTFSSFNFFRASFWFNKVLQKLIKSYKSELRHLFQYCILIPRKCPCKTPFQHTVCGWGWGSISYQWIFEGEGYASFLVKVLLGREWVDGLLYLPSHPTPTQFRRPWTECCRLEWRRICLHNNNNQQGFFSQLLTYRGTMGWKNSYFYTPRCTWNISEILQRIW